MTPSECIDKYLDLLVKAEAYGVKKYAEILQRSTSRVYTVIRGTVNSIARKLKYEYVHFNAEDAMRAFAKECRCSVTEFKNALTAYIEAQDKSLWETMPFAGVPSAEELLGHILERHRPGLAACSDIHISETPASVEDACLSAVRKAWADKWEGLSGYRAKLYDIRNRLVEVSRFSSKSAALEFADGRTNKKPEAYSRYVICLRSPVLGARDAVCKIRGGFAFGHICTDQRFAKEWKVELYDGADRMIQSYIRDYYIDTAEQFREQEASNAQYGVVSYRRSREGNFCVQYFKSYPYYQNPGLVDIIDERIAGTKETDIFADDFPPMLYRSEK